MSHNRKLPFVNINSIGLERAVCQQTSKTAKGITNSQSQLNFISVLINGYTFRLLKSHHQAIKSIYKKYILHEYTPLKEHAVAQFVEALRYNLKVASSIPDGVSGIFY
jgi:hypothetical protein